MSEELKTTESPLMADEKFKIRDFQLQQKALENQSLNLALQYNQHIANLRAQEEPLVKDFKAFLSNLETLYGCPICPHDFKCIEPASPCTTDVTT